MLDSVRDSLDGSAIPISVVAADEFDAWRAGRSVNEQTWLAATAPEAKPGTVALFPTSDGGIGGALILVGEAPDLWSFAGLPDALPPGDYRMETDAGVTLDDRLATAAALGWMLGSYRYDRYKTRDDAEPRTLLAPPDADLALARRLAGAVGLTRDLVNTPANDMGPDDLEAAAFGVAEAHNASYRSIVGDDLLDHDYPMIHAVGRASDRAPRLIDLTWGPEDAPKVTLVGKGVCFDSGGLDLKPASNMLLMKKDMGGAAHVLGLAGAVMDAGLNLRLRVLIPAVENSIAGNALPPARRAGDPQPARPSRSATPTPKAAWSSPTRWRKPIVTPPIWLSTWRRSPAPRGWRSAPTCRRCLPTTTTLPARWRIIPSASPTLCGGCRYGGPTANNSKHRSRILTIFPKGPMAARLPPHFFCGNFWKNRVPGPILTLWLGIVALVRGSRKVARPWR